MGTDGASPTLTVYSRTYCHLCDELIAGLQTLQARFRFDLEIVDVDSDEALEARYGEDVPVVEHASYELCRHRLDVALVTDYLAKIG
jgi:thiol-disulfide isomerase/thioredoxin